MRAALRRAARLQADAAEQLENEARLRIEAHTGSKAAPDGFLPEDVESAAVEAGISAEYIRRALVEQEALGEHAEELAPWMDRTGDRMLGTRQRSIDISRVVAAEPEATLEAMRRIFPAHPYGLTLIDSIGGTPLEGGVLVFQLPKMSGFSTSVTPFGYAASVIDLFQIAVTMRPVDTAGKPACEVTLRGDLRTSMRRNVWAGLGVSGVIGGVGGGIALGGAIAVGAMLPLAIAVGAIGLTGFGGASALGYGAVYRYYLRKMTAELETLLKIVGTNARTGGSFRPPQPPPAIGEGGEFTAIIGSF
ncbi:MAG TPA: hypothetical protein VFI91_06875 [Longimicrobiaceae bacterium]|nr:hypothetical protein [Longimicrobiaceae bacterium]